MTYLQRELDAAYAGIPLSLRVRAGNAVVPAIGLIVDKKGFAPYTIQSRGSVAQ